MQSCAADPSCPFYSDGNPVAAYEALAAALDASPVVGRSVAAARRPARPVLRHRSRLRDSTALGRAVPRARRRAGRGRRPAVRALRRVRPAIVRRELLQRHRGLHRHHCLDDPGPTDPSRFPRIDARIRQAAPHMGMGFGYQYACAGWPARLGRRRSRLTAAGAGPVLVVGTTGRRHHPDRDLAGRWPRPGGRRAAHRRRLPAHRLRTQRCSTRRRGPLPRRPHRARRGHRLRLSLRRCGNRGAHSRSYCDGQGQPRKGQTMRTMETTSPRSWLVDEHGNPTTGSSEGVEASTTGPSTGCCGSIPTWWIRPTPSSPSMPASRWPRRSWPTCSLMSTDAPDLPAARAAHPAMACGGTNEREAHAHASPSASGWTATGSAHPGRSTLSSPAGPATCWPWPSATSSTSSWATPATCATARAAACRSWIRAIPHSPSSGACRPSVSRSPATTTDRRRAGL